MLFRARHASQVAADVWHWPNFKPLELADRWSGELQIDTDFLDRLQRLRDVVGFPLIINSGYRDPAHNDAVSTTGENGPHTTGHASDIRIYGERAVVLVYHAIGLGFTGIGLQQKGSVESRYVHLDDLTAPGFPRPNIWTY